MDRSALNYNWKEEFNSMKQDKVDKGFELFYNRLSYRRKFIRTIWLIPVGIVVGILIAYISLIVSLYYWVLFILTLVKQLKHNYTMWKKETRKN